MLPGTGRGGYATFGRWLCTSKYILFEPIGRVGVELMPGGGRNLDGRAAVFGGNAGFSGGCLRANFAGTKGTSNQRTAEAREDEEGA